MFRRYNQLLGIIPSDPGVLQKLGEMYDQIGDKQQAYQFYSDVSSVYFHAKSNLYIKSSKLSIFSYIFYTFIDYSLTDFILLISK